MVYKAHSGLQEGVYGATQDWFDLTVIKVELGRCSIDGEGYMYLLNHDL